MDANRGREWTRIKSYAKASPEEAEIYRRSEGRSFFTEGNEGNEGSDGVRIWVAFE